MESNERTNEHMVYSLYLTLDDMLGEKSVAGFTSSPKHGRETPPISKLRVDMKNLLYEKRNNIYSPLGQRVNNIEYVYKKVPTSLSNLLVRY